jgi:hypothetical protein
VSLQIDYDDKNKTIKEDLGQNLLDYVRKMEESQVSIPDEKPSIDSFVKNKASQSRRKP